MKLQTLRPRKIVEGMSPEETIEWVVEHTNVKHRDEVTVLSDGRVLFSANVLAEYQHVEIRADDIEKLPVKFAPMHSSFVLIDCPRIKTLEGLPNAIGDGHTGIVISAADLDDVTTIPKIIVGDLVVGGGIKSFHDIHKHIHLEGNIVLNYNKTLKSSLLGVFFIKGHVMGIIGDENVEEKLQAAIKIISHHLDGLNYRDETANGCMLAAQEQLLEAGLDEYAEL